MTSTDTTAVLRAELTRRLQGHLPAYAVTDAADAAAQIVANTAPEAVTPRLLIDAAIAACPPQYRVLAEVGMAVAQGVSVWLDSRVVEVQAGSVTVTDRRG